MLPAKGYQAILEIIVQSVNKSEYVVGAVILAMDEPYSIGREVNPADGEVCAPNRFVGDFVKRHENLYFGASVNPNRKVALEGLEWSKENGVSSSSGFPILRISTPPIPLVETTTRGWWPSIFHC